MTAFSWHGVLGAELPESQGVRGSQTIPLGSQGVWGAQPLRMQGVRGAQPGMRGGLGGRQPPQDDFLVFPCVFGVLFRLFSIFQYLQLLKGPCGHDARNKGLEKSQKTIFQLPKGPCGHDNRTKGLKN